MSLNILKSRLFGLLDDEPRISSSVLLALAKVPIENNNDKSNIRDKLFAAAIDSVPASSDYVFVRALLIYYEVTRKKEALKRALALIADNAKDTTNGASDQQINGAAQRYYACEYAANALFAYRITNNVTLRKIAERHLKHGFDWVSFYHIFPHTRGFALQMPYNKVKLAQSETTQEDMFIAESAATARGDLLAIGIKDCAVRAIVSGGVKDNPAATLALSKLTRYHGLANGMFTSDAHVEGRSPEHACSLDATLSLMASLTYAARTLDEHIVQIVDALERILYNALPAFITDDCERVALAQRVNEVSLTDTHSHYSLPNDASLYRAADADIIARILTAECDARSLAFTRDNARNKYTLLMFETATHAIDGGSVRVESDYPCSDQVRIVINVDSPRDSRLCIRIPAWANGARLTYNGKTRDCEAGKLYMFRENITSEGEVLLVLPNHTRVQSDGAGTVSIHRGALLYALPVESDVDWRVGFVRLAEHSTDSVDINNTVEIVCVSLPEWEMKRGRAAGPPRGIMLDGRETFVKRLAPYRDTLLRVAQFPVVGGR